MRVKLNTVLTYTRIFLVHLSVKHSNAVMNFYKVGVQKSYFQTLMMFVLYPIFGYLTMHLYRIN